jgi:hypothetical protein
MANIPIVPICTKIAGIIDGGRTARIEIETYKAHATYTHTFYAKRPKWIGAIVVFDENYSPVVAETKYIEDAIFAVMDIIESEGYKITNVDIKEE